MNRYLPLALLLGLAAPLAWAQDPPTRIYFGDLHVHTSLSLDAYGGGVRADAAFACDYARYHNHLDFVGIADHGAGIDQNEWARYTATVDSRNDELDPGVDGTGRFVTLLGYEWTSSSKANPDNPDVYGHKNVFFRTSAVPPFCPDAFNQFQGNIDSSTPTALFNLLNTWKAGGLGGVPAGADYLAIPHTSAKGVSPTKWQFVDPVAQPIVEVFSKHGSSESLSYFPVEGFMPDRSYPAALNRWFVNGDPGYKLGAIASSDTHDGMASGHDPDPDQLLASWQTTGGLVAVHARELKRETIFDALKAKRCYGTSGPRIRLWMTVETDRTQVAQPMGSTVDFNNTVRIRAVVRGDTAPVDQILIYRGTPAAANGESVLVAAISVNPTTGEVDWTDPAPPATNAYYRLVALQQPTLDYANIGPITTRERAWSSPVWVVKQP